MNTSNDNNESVTVGAGGMWAKLKGREPFLRVLLLISMLASWYLVNINLARWGNPIDLEATLLAQTNLLVIHDKNQTHAREALTEAINRMTYVNWVCSPLNTEVRMKEKCAALDLQMPLGLREMMHSKGP